MSKALTVDPTDRKVLRNGFFSQVTYCGGYSGEDPPLPIPNREVKLTIADGTDPPVGRVGSRRSSGARTSSMTPGLLRYVGLSFEPLVRMDIAGRFFSAASFPFILIQHHHPVALVTHRYFSLPLVTPHYPRYFAPFSSVKCAMVNALRPGLCPEPDIDRSSIGW